MAMEKKTFLFNAKNGVFTADLTDTLKTTPDVMNSLDLSKFKIKEVDFDNTTHYWDGGESFSLFQTAALHELMFHGGHF